MRREIREESGLEVKIVKLIRIYHIFRGEKTAENELVGIMYWCRTDNESVQLSEEHTDYKWISAEEALEMMEKPGMKKDIEAYIRERK